jgi:hypothetical protein
MGKNRATIEAHLLRDALEDELRLDQLDTVAPDEEVDPALLADIAALEAAITVERAKSTSSGRVRPTRPVRN